MTNQGACPTITAVPPPGAQGRKRPLSSEGSVTRCLARLRAGDQAAAQPLWERYFRRLVGLARHKLQGRPRRVADEEDVALSAFDSFCRGAERGRFPRLLDRDDLWRVLAVITIRKAIDLQRRRRPEENAGTEDLEQFLSREPPPELAAEMAEEYRRLLDRLGDPQLQAVALWKVEGYTNEEIARRLGCVERSVERKLQRIRILWEESSRHEDDPPDRLRAAAAGAGPVCRRGVRPL